MNNKTNNTRKALIAGAVAVMSLALPMGVQANAKAPEGCRSFSTGRTTCSYSNGLGGTSWNSYNPNSGYSSNGFRQKSGGSSWGSYDFTMPSGRTGTRSYSSSGGSDWGSGYGSKRSSSSFGSRNSWLPGGGSNLFGIRGNSSLFGDCWGC